MDPRICVHRNLRRIQKYGRIIETKLSVQYYKWDCNNYCAFITDTILNSNTWKWGAGRVCILLFFRFIFRVVLYAGITKLWAKNNCENQRWWIETIKSVLWVIFISDLYLYSSYYNLLLFCPFFSTWLLIFSLISLAIVNISISVLVNLLSSLSGNFNKYIQIIN